MGLVWCTYIKQFTVFSDLHSFRQRILFWFIIDVANSSLPGRLRFRYALRRVCLNAKRFPFRYNLRHLCVSLAVKESQLHEGSIRQRLSILVTGDALVETGV